MKSDRLLHESILSVEGRRARARELRAEGLTYREIGERLGYSLKTVHQWLSDPDGSKLKARKDSYRGTCDTCGGLTDGSNGPGKAPTTCLDCLTWTREAIVEAFREWGDEHGGVPPRCADTRGCGGRLPNEHSVRRVFGSWNEGLLAAGYDLVCDRRASTTQEIIESVRAGERVEDIADRYGWSPANVHERLKNAGTSVSAERRVGGVVVGIPDEEREETIRLYMAGHTLAEVAEIMGLSAASVVWGRLHRWGVPRRSRHGEWRSAA